jgi:uncharacterized OsmC-like protein
MSDFAPQFQLEYAGDLRTEMTHLGSNSVVITDAPVDNHGKGQAFSPTDLTSSALASCMMTMIGIKANDLELDVTFMRAKVQKTMGSGPRRIVRIAIELEVSIPQASERDRTILERTAHTCPVGQSLHPDIDQAICLMWKD